MAGCVVLSDNMSQLHKQECIPVGYLPSALYHTGGSLSGGSFCPGGLCRGGSSRGVSVQGGLCPGTSIRNMIPETRPPRRNMGPETETPQKEHRTRQPDRR